MKQWDDQQHQTKWKLRVMKLMHLPSFCQQEEKKRKEEEEEYANPHLVFSVA